MLVLIATFLHARKAYCYHHFFEWAKNQDYKNCQYYIQVHTGEFGSKDAVKNLRENARSRALDVNADYLFFIDCDTIPPLDVITRLQGVQAGIVSGIYFSRTSSDHHRAVCWKHNDLDQTFLNSEMVSDIDGAGMGCALISKTVLQNVDFKHEIPDDDYPYYLAAKKKGFTCKSLNTLRCKHYFSEEGFSFNPFGQKDNSPMLSYKIKSSDGITINGKKYKGEVRGDTKLLQALKSIDEAYLLTITKTQTGKLPYKKGSSTWFEAKNNDRKSSSHP